MPMPLVTVCACRGHTGEYHASVLHEITDVLSEMGLDVIKALMHSSQQPGQSHHEHSAGGSNHGGNACGNGSRHAGKDGTATESVAVEVRAPSMRASS